MSIETKRVVGKLPKPGSASGSSPTGASRGRKSSSSWRYKHGPTASVRVLSAKRRISAGMRELQSELLRADRTAALKQGLRSLSLRTRSEPTK